MLFKWPDTHCAQMLKFLNTNKKQTICLLPPYGMAKRASKEMLC